MPHPDQRPAIAVGWSLVMVILAAFVVVCFADSVRGAELPAGYYKHGRECAKIQQRVYGLAYWSSLLLAQIHQESWWRADVCSPYACGLTQFTPATQRAIERQIGVSGSIFKPEHGCLLQGHLMRELARDAGPRFDGFVAQWSAAFRTYNGSPASFWREHTLCDRPRSTVAMEGCCVRRRAFCRENVEYPGRIFRLWPLYLTAGGWWR